MADLVRHLSILCTVDFLGIQSYGAGTAPSGEVKITKDLDVSIEGREVLIVEDILDTGRTFTYLQEVLRAHGPHSLKLVALLNKNSRRLVPVEPDYTGFEIPDVFVVGYGLDFDQKYRHLRDLRYLPSPQSLFEISNPTTRRSSQPPEATVVDCMRACEPAASHTDYGYRQTCLWVPSPVTL